MYCILNFLSIQDDISNFTPALHRHVVSQAKEIARQCVEPPIKKKPNAPKFEPGPSLKKAIQFMIKCVKDFPNESCQFCHKNLFPEDPEVLFMNFVFHRKLAKIYVKSLLLFFANYKFFQNYINLQVPWLKNCHVSPW